MDKLNGENSAYAVRKGGISAFCVIQKVPKKRTGAGEPKEIVVEESRWTMNGEPQPVSYSYRGSEERFERPVKWAYKVSIHHSTRENGRVQKKQVVICTIGYYDIVDFGGDYQNYVRIGQLKKKLQLLGVREEELDRLVYDKLNPIIEQVQAEFQQTEEYQARKEHERIKNEHRQRVKAFAKQYGCTESDYNQIYDVFGVLRNPEYLKQIQEQCRQREEYEQRSRESSRSYWENSSSNHSSSSYQNSGGGNCTDEKKAVLKQFYRVLSKHFHPDANPDRDTSEEMKLLNQLKNEWGV